MTDLLDSLKIEPISKAHVRDKFSCGKPPLNQYPRQNDVNNISKTFVAADEKNIAQETIHQLFNK